MNIGALFVKMNKIFPDPISMDDIHRMKRRDLTAEEKKKPYAKYFYKELAAIPPADLEKVNAGPVDPAKATSVHNRNDLMKPGYLDEETGYTVMPDGSGFAATLVKMPGVTPEMLDWWFNWHPLESLRYAIWCPVAHEGISAETPEAHKDASGVALEERNYGRSHFPVEGFVLEGASRLRIWFRRPEEIGLDSERFTEPNISRCYAATVTAKQGPARIPINIFMHAVRQVDGGVEYRSRYWLGRTIDARRRIVKSRVRLPRSMVYSMARCNCIHSLIEYNNLASILPALYDEQQGRIR